MEYLHRCDARADSSMKLVRGALGARRHIAEALLSVPKLRPDWDATLQ